MSARSLAIVNMKGGVGKSTSTVMLAEGLSLMGQRVLVVDLDPQASSTLMLLQQSDWIEASNAGRTVDQYFANGLVNAIVQPLDAYILSPQGRWRVSDVKGAESISLVPSSPHLRLVERDVFELAGGREGGLEAVRDQTRALMAQALKDLRGDFDTILFDCPPGISIFAEAVIGLVDLVVMPTIPDPVSDLGLTAFRNAILTDARPQSDGKRDVMILPTKVRDGLKDHEAMIKAWRKADDRRVADTVIADSVIVSRAMAPQASRRTLKRKYQRLAGAVTSLAQEMAQGLKRVG